MIPIIAARHPFRVQTDRLEVPDGLTLAEIMRQVFAAGPLPGAHVFIGDQLIREEYWHVARPRPGVPVTVRAMPRGGEGKDPARTILTIAVIAASMATGQYYAASPLLGSFASAGVMYAGMLLVDQIAPLTPPAQPDTIEQSQSYSLTGGNNQLAPYGAVPFVLGRHRITPPYAARPYTEVSGNDQYLRLIFNIGYGPVNIAEERIGETLIYDPSTGDSVFTDVTVERRSGYSTEPPINLFANSVVEESLSVLLLAADGWQQRTTGADTDEISVDLTFPGGLFRIGDDGKLLAASVECEAQYSVSGANDWQPLAPIIKRQAQSVAFSPYYPAGGKSRIDRVVIYKLGYISIIQGTPAAVPVAPMTPGAAYSICTFNPAQTRPVPVDARDQEITAIDPGSFLATQSATDFHISIASGLFEGGLFGHSTTSTAAVRVNATLPVPTGQYDVRVRRVTGDQGDTYVDDVYWSALRSIRYEAPVSLDGVAQVAMRIKASDQLNGTIDTFNCIVESVSLDWDSATQTWVTRATSNPASIYRYLLQGPFNPRPLADSRIDLATLQQWHEQCEASGWEFNAVIDFESTLFELLNNVASAGRASFGMRDGLYTVVRDNQQTTIVQHFSPRNSWGFSAIKSFADVPHALKCRYFDAEENYQQVERIVYDDGYDENTATRFETVDLFGVTSADQAHKAGRYHIAVTRLRPEQYTLNVDIEHLVCTRGDLVRVQHDVPMWGVQSARIKSVTADGGGDITAAIIDDRFAMEAGRSYGARIRLAAGSSVTTTLLTDPGEQQSITFSPAIPAASAPAAGDLILFGETGSESVELLVSRIEMQSDLAAKLTLVDHSPEVYAADTGPIPPFDPQITVPTEMRIPDPPVIDGIRSDESVLIKSDNGAVITRMVILLGKRSGLAAVTPLRAEVQARPSGVGVYRTLPTSGADTGEVAVTDVDDGVTYDVRIRYITTLGRASTWTVFSHTVIGKTSRPPDVPGLLYESPWITWRYPNAPVDLAGFRVRYHAGDRRSWSDATQAHDHIITENRYNSDGLGSGVRTIFVKAVDIAGNESANAAILVKDLGDPIVSNIILTTDYRADGWPGTITNGDIVIGDLLAQSTALAWTGSDNTTAWSGNDAALTWTQDFLALTYIAEYVPAPDVVGESIVLETTIAGGSYQLLYRTDSPLPIWGPDDAAAFWDTLDTIDFWAPAPEYKAWPGRVDDITRQKYEFMATTSAGAVQGEISQFLVQIDVPDIEERFDDLVIAAGGTRLPITESYRIILNVSLTLQDDGGSAVTAKVMDKSASLGPLIKCFNSSGTAVAGLIDARIQGY